MSEKIQFGFFGTSAFSVIVLDELKAAGFIPKLIVTAPDKPAGRHLVLTPPEVKVWAEKNSIPVLQPTTLKTIESANDMNKFAPFDVFIVASYGKIIPENILKIPARETLNVHPSLLPRLRGASPIQSAILHEQETGVTIIHLDAQMDHGPIVSQKKILGWGDNPPNAPYLEEILAVEGGKLLVKTLESWVKGKIKETPQDDSKATFCKMITKEDGQINLNDNPEKNYKKILAFAEWPTTYFFHNGKRIKITDAKLKNGELKIVSIIPEGKKEMSYEDFMRTLESS